MIFDHPLIPLVLDLESPDPQVRLRALQQIALQLATPGFLETLRQQRLTALVYHTLTPFSREEVGEVPLLMELRRDYFASLMKYRIQDGAVQVFLKGLEDAGVEPLVLKGGDVRHRLYDDPATRPMGDLDTMIPPADLLKVRGLLKEQGYTALPRDADKVAGFNIRFAWEESYRSPQSDALVVDLHWEIRKMGAFYRLPYGPLRARAMVRDMDGAMALVLCPEHLLMNLSLNALEELEEAGIIKLVDLHRALQRLPLDWDLFLKDAAAFGVLGPMGWMLQRMEQLRPGIVPPAVQRQLSAYTPDWCDRLILRRTGGSLVVGFLAAVWRYLPVKEWPGLIKGKIWPSDEFIRATPQEFGNRLGYLQHLLRRTRDKT